MDKSIISQSHAKSDDARFHFLFLSHVNVIPAIYDEISSGTRLIN